MEHLPVQTQSAVATRQEMEWTADQVKLIKDTICKGSSDDEFKLFLYTAKRTGLDPLVRQIHAVKRWDSNLKRETMAIQVGIDGYRVIADRTGTYAGQDAPIYTFNKDSEIDSATITVYRLVGGHRVGFSATAFYDEYVQTTREGSPTRMWQKMPRVMIAKCAEALAMRKAFPNDLSGIYTDDEMAQAGEPKQIKAEQRPEPEPIPEEPRGAEYPPRQSMPAPTNGNRVSDDDILDAVQALEVELEQRGALKPDEMGQLRLTRGGNADLFKMTKIGKRSYHDVLGKLAAKG